MIKSSSSSSLLVHAIRSCGSLKSCQAIHAQVIKQLNYEDAFIGDRLVSLYSKFGVDNQAQKLFDEIPNKDLASWNSLISSFSRKGCVDKCMNMFFRMRYEMGFNEVTVLSVISACTDKGSMDEGKCLHALVSKAGHLSEIKVGNCLINMYGKFGCLDAAYGLFEAMPFCNVVSWNSMVAIHVQNGCSPEGVWLFNLMRRDGSNPDQATIVALLQACIEIGFGKLGEGVHGYIFRCGLDSDVRIATALLNFYAKLGRLDASRDVFVEMRDPDRIAWTAMLAGYAVNGQGRRAIEFFELMVKKGVKPDHVTFTHLLSACSHSGLVEEGKKYFQIMSKVYGVVPRLDQYACMVDLLGRTGHLIEAYEVIDNMPMEPTSGVLGALLNACNVYGNTKLGKEVAERVIALDPTDHRNYVMLSNICSAAGLWKDASVVKALMKDRGLIRNPGCSFIEHESTILSRNGGLREESRKNVK